MFLYVGTFTNRMLDGHAEGLSVFRIDDATGGLSHVQTISGQISPSWLALHPTLPVLYTVEREWVTGDASQGAVVSFRIDATSGQLTPLNREPSQGQSPAHITVHPDGRHVLVSHFLGGQVVVLPLDVDGRVEPACDVVQHVGSGPQPRQESPHAHAMEVDATGAYIVACDLGMDKVLIYQLDQATGKLGPGPQPFAAVPPGSGARHAAFHPSNRFLYVLNELTATVSAFSFDAERGSLELLQTIEGCPETYEGRRSGAEIAIHPSGAFLYMSNRGHDSVGAFAIDQLTGHLTLISHTPSQGKTPRNFVIHPSGGSMLVANQSSDSIFGFAIDTRTGRLTPTGLVVETASPVCLAFR